MNLIKLAEDIINGYEIRREQAMELWHADYDELLSMSKKIKHDLCGNYFDLCTIISGKSGRCSEDCTYCAQSIYYDTGIKTFKLLDKEKIVDDALKNYSKGIRRYSVVTSGKRASEDELEKLCDIFKSIKELSDMKLCSSNGLLTYEEFIRLEKAGISRVHNNLETSRNHFPKVCTTHSYDEKVETIKSAMKAGIEVCSGGIIGLGESLEDRVSLAFELKNLGIKSIPLNLLNPIKGTPLENYDLVSEEEFLRTAAIFRFINPSAIIRLAGGRNLLNSHGKKAFESSINGSISGELLTTYGNDTERDIEMIEGLGYEIND